MRMIAYRPLPGAYLRAELAVKDFIPEIDARLIAKRRKSQQSRKIHGTVAFIHSHFGAKLGADHIVLEVDALTQPIA